MKKITSCALLALAVLIHGNACATDHSATQTSQEVKVAQAAPAAAPAGKPAKVEAPVAAAVVLADKVGAQVPAWTATVVGGDSESSDKLKGKPYGIIFVNNSCASCRAELADMLSMKFKKDFTLFVAAVDARLDRAVGTYRDEMKVTFPILDDSKFKLASLFNIAFTPASVIIDGGGKVEYWGAGYTADSKAKTILAFDKYLTK